MGSRGEAISDTLVLHVPRDVIFELIKTELLQQCPGEVSDLGEGEIRVTLPTGTTGAEIREAAN